MRIAVIGSGYWGKNLVRNFHELGCLAAVCDLDPEKLAQVKKLYPRVKTTPSLQGILRNPEISAVAISTPASTHYALAKESVLSGKDVFVEKPIALSLKEAEDLARLAGSGKKIIMVGHLLEYHPGILKLKELLARGRLGDIYYVYSNRMNLGKIRREENILWSFAPHDISVMLTLLGEMPVSVSAHGGHYLHKRIADTTVSTLSFESGVRGHIFVSWLHPYKEQKLVVVGNKKMAVFDDVTKKNKLLLYNHKIELGKEVPVTVNDTSPEIVSFDSIEPLKAECGHFLQCVTKRENPKTDAGNGLRVLKVLMACQESLEKNGKETKIGA